VLVTNPLDAMGAAGVEDVRLPDPAACFGMAGVLDSRAASAPSSARGAERGPWRTSTAFVLGGHGGHDGAAARATRRWPGIPITELLPKAKIDELVQRTAKRRRPRSSRCSKRAAPTTRPPPPRSKMVEAILKDKKKDPARARRTWTASTA